METPGTSEDIIYHVDPDGLITFVNSRWDAFALANASPSVLSTAVVGRPIASFISGSETRHLFEILTRHVLKAERAVTVPFRCDAPAERRHMQLICAPDPLGGVIYRSHLMAAEARASIRLLVPDASRNNTLLRVCSWCNRGRLEDRWAEIEEVIRAYDLFDAPLLPEITHGLCSDCERMVLNDFVLSEPLA